MKNIHVSLFLVAALAIFSTAANGGITVNELDTINLQVFVPCAAGGAGEIVDLSGALHSLITLTVNGNNVSGIMHFQPAGVSGSGESTGLQYQGTGVTSTGFKMSLQNGQATQTLINRFDIIGQGPANNFILQETVHIAFNADGTVTVAFDNFVVDCK